QLRQPRGMDEPGGRSAEPRLAVVVDQQAVLAEPDPGRCPVRGQLAVMHQMPDGETAGEFGEVCDEPPVAAPPQTLAAHDGCAFRAGLGEDLVYRGEELRLPHVAGVTAERRLAPGHIRCI